MNRIEFLRGYFDMGFLPSLGALGALAVGLVSESLPSTARVALVAGAALVGLCACYKKARASIQQRAYHRNTEALWRAIWGNDIPKALEIIHKFSPDEIPWKSLIGELSRLVANGCMEGARVILQHAPSEWQYRIWDSLYKDQFERFDMERQPGRNIDKRAIWFMPYSGDNNTTFLGVAIWLSGHIKDYENEVIGVIGELPIKALQIPCAGELTPLEYASQCGAWEIFFAIFQKLPSEVKETIPRELVLKHASLGTNLVQFLQNRGIGLSSTRARRI